MISKQLLTSSTLRSFRTSLSQNRSSLSRCSIRQFSQVDYSVYKGQQELFDSANKKKSFRRYNRSKNLKWYALFFAFGASLSYNYSAHEIVDKFLTTKLPTNPMEKAVYLQNLENSLFNLPVVKKLESNSEFKPIRSWSSLNKITELPLSSESQTIHDTLTEPGCIAIPPLTFHNENTKESISIIHLGKRLSGYPFLVHGGMLSLVIDEVFKNDSALALNLDDSNSVHTEDLTLNYKMPTLVDNFVVLKTEAYELGNNEVQMKGTLQTPSGRTLVKAAALLKVDEEKKNFIFHGLNEESENESRGTKGWFWI